jgi:hypothetical protein
LLAADDADRRVAFERRDGRQYAIVGDLAGADESPTQFLRHAISPF